MKIRSGFVSNSSSSSFVMIVKKDEYDRVRNKQDPFDQAIIDYAMIPEIIFGDECMIYENYSSDGGYDSFSEMDSNEVLNQAKQLAEEQGRPICDHPDMPTDTKEQEEWLLEGIEDIVRDVNTFFSGDKVWSRTSYDS